MLHETHILLIIAVQDINRQVYILYLCLPRYALRLLYSDNVRSLTPLVGSSCTSRTCAIIAYLSKL